MYSLVDWKQLRKESLSLKMKTETNKTEKQREKRKKEQYTRTVEQVQTIKYSYRKY